MLLPLAAMAFWMVAYNGSSYEKRMRHTRNFSKIFNFFFDEPTLETTLEANWLGAFELNFEAEIDSFWI